MPFQLGLRPNPKQIFDGGIDLPAADLVIEILLAIEIAGLNPIKINQNQLADFHPDKGFGHIRPQTAESGDSNNS